MKHIMQLCYVNTDKQKLAKMKDSLIKLNVEVVRSKGDYVVGRIGKIVDIDFTKQRAQVQWNGESKTWVSFGSIEPNNEAYEIIRFGEKDRSPKTGRIPYPKYIKINP